MKPWELLDQTTVPGTGEPMTLHRRDRDLVIRISGHELMSTRAHTSEDALGELPCAVLAARPNPAPNVLIGGLGMGFTLAAALKELPEHATVTVAELVPAVIEWNRGPLGEAAGRPIDDPRTELHLGDVAGLIRHQTARWDAILLDIDNGPEGLTQPANDSLYHHNGLLAAHEALKPGGILAIWSVSTAGAFTSSLKRAGFRVTTTTVHAHGSHGRRHVIWLAARR